MTYYQAPLTYGNVIGNTLYFEVDDVSTGVELWKTDGTTSGTSMVKDINVGSNGYEWSSPQYHHSIGDTLFFIADDGIHGAELWRTNGTSSGTMLVEDYNPSTTNIRDQPHGGLSSPGCNVGTTISYSTEGMT